MVKKKHTKTSPQNKVTPNSSFKKNKSQDYLSINEQSLPELFQALIQKDIDRLNRLLDTRPTSYIGVKDRKNRYIYYDDIMMLKAVLHSYVLYVYSQKGSFFYNFGHL